VNGNGVIKTHEHTVGEFKNIGIAGNIHLYITQGPATPLRIETDENLFDFIELVQEGSRVEIKVRNGYNLKPSNEIKVYASSPLVNEFHAAGSCDIIGQNKITTTDDMNIELSGSCDVQLELNSPRVKADLAGACSLVLKGETKKLDVEGSGSTDIKSMDLLAEEVNVDISGSGDAEVFASVKLDVDISGSGSVRYKGNAAVNKNVAGSGHITKVN
jgi:hypothetical protein